MAGKSGWNGIADLAGDAVQAGCRELVVTREALQHGPFAQGDGPIFLWMAEAPVGQAMETGRDGWCGPVPVHAPVDVKEIIVLAFVSINLQFWVILPGHPCPPIMGREAETAQVFFRQGRRRMHEVRLVRMARRDDWETVVWAEHGGQRDGVTIGLGKGNMRKMAGSDEQITPAVLRYTVELGIDDVLSIVVTLCLKGLQKAGEIAALLCLQSRHVLQDDETRQEVLDEALELLEQKGRFLTFGARGLNLAPILAGTATHKDKPGVIDTEVESFGEFLEGQLCDVLVQKTGRGIVGFVGGAALCFVIDAAKDVDTRTAQAMRHAPRTTKKIDGTENGLNRGWRAERLIHSKRPVFRGDSLA